MRTISLAAGFASGCLAGGLLCCFNRLLVRRCIWVSHQPHHLLVPNATKPEVKDFNVTNCTGSIADMMTIGDMLSEARRSRSVSISDAAEATRIREIYLVALEAEDWPVIGGRAWARGFLHSYAQYLHLNAAEVVARFDTEVITIDPDSSISGINPETLARFRRKTLVKRLTIGMAFLCAAAVLLVMFVNRSSFQQLNDEPLAPAPVDATPSADLAAQPSQDNAAMLPAPVTEADRAKAVLRTILANMTLQESTGLPMGPPSITVQTSGIVSVSPTYPLTSKPVTIHAGENATFSDAEVVQLVFNDSAGVTVTVNGELLPVLGAPGQSVQLTCIASQVACEAISPAP